MRSPEKETEDEIYSGFVGVPPEGSLWIVIPRLLRGVAISTLVIGLIFWLQFGEFSSYILVLAAIAAGFQVLVVVGMRHRGRLNEPIVRPNAVLDMVGALWLPVVVFGSIIGWFTADAAIRFPSASIALHAVTVSLTMILPILMSIPNYRYVTTRNAYITLPLLLIPSLLPSLIGYSSAAEVWRVLNT